MGILDAELPMPTVDLKSSAQNAFVQDWLTEFQKEFEDEEGWGHIDSVVEGIQELYSFTDHEQELKRESSRTHQGL